MRDEGHASTSGLVTSEGAAYPLLARLRRDGLVDTTWQESTQEPPRRYYRLTPAGHAALHAFIELVPASASFNGTILIGVAAVLLPRITGAYWFSQRRQFIAMSLNV